MATLAGLTFYTSLLAPDERTKLFVATATIVVAIYPALRRVVVRQVRARVAARDYATEMERQACLDPLTGLANRRIVFKRLDELVDAGKPMWLGLWTSMLEGDQRTSWPKDGRRRVERDCGATVRRHRFQASASAGSAGIEFALIFERATRRGRRQAPLHGVDRRRRTARRRLTIETQMSGSIGLVSFPDMAADVPSSARRRAFPYVRPRLWAAARLWRSMRARPPSSGHHGTRKTARQGRSRRRTLSRLPATGRSLDQQGDRLRGLCAGIVRRARAGAARPFHSLRETHRPDQEHHARRARQGARGAGGLASDHLHVVQHLRAECR